MITESISPQAGHLAPAENWLDVPALLAAYHDEIPDPAVAGQRVRFGTSGHRGCPLETSFNEWHVLAIAQAVCDWRQVRGIRGPLFMGVDTHALSAPAAATALEVFAANRVDVMLATNDEYTPTPAVSHAILAYNRHRPTCADRKADGIVVTPSHNPPRDGGIKYNLPDGGPADLACTGWIERAANRLLRGALTGVRRMPHAQALMAATTHRHNYLQAYVADLPSVVDLDLVGSSGLRIAVDPMGGAGLNYWRAIAERYGLNLTLLNDRIDPAFGFLPCDWDGQIRMDPSSPWAMQRLIQARHHFDLGLACDTDHDRHGIVTPSGGLQAPNHYLTVAIDYLFANRPHWGVGAAVGKTVVSSQMIDRLAGRLGRRLFEVPVGFKWFASGLAESTLGFAGEESAGASFLRRDGLVWTTDKDGIVAALLAAEMTARNGRDPAARHAQLADELGHSSLGHVQAHASVQQCDRLAGIRPAQIRVQELAGEPIEAVLSSAPGNDAAIDGIKVRTRSGWFAARPSGTEALYKIYAESFRDAAHLQVIQAEAQAIIDEVIA